MKVHAYSSFIDILDLQALSGSSGVDLDISLNLGQIQIDSAQELKLSTVQQDNNLCVIAPVIKDISQSGCNMTHTKGSPAVDDDLAITANKKGCL